MEMKKFNPTFVVPHWSKGDEASITNIKKTVQAVLDQSDSDWHLLIVDDGSPSQKAIDVLHEIQKLSPEKIDILFLEKNVGTGRCRNAGVKWAADKGADFILFNDSDDISHPCRLENTRRIFEENENVTVVYSPFEVIDENDNDVSLDNITPSVKEIMDVFGGIPPEGDNVWIDIGTLTGYINQTSATSVKADIALRFPFPMENVSEDAHTWMRYSAGGGRFFFSRNTPTKYRIPQGKGSASREREGGQEIFYKNMLRVNHDGFVRAFDIASALGKVHSSDLDSLLVKFFIRSAVTMHNEKQHALAVDQIKRAKAVSAEKVIEVISKNCEFYFLAEKYINTKMA